MVAGGDAVGAKVGAGLLARRALDGDTVEPDQPARRLAGQLEPRVGRRLQRDRQPRLLPGAQLDVLIVAQETVVGHRHHVRAGRLLEVIGEWSPTFTLSTSTVASAGTTVSCSLPARLIDHQYPTPLSRR